MGFIYWTKTATKSSYTLISEPNKGTIIQTDMQFSDYELRPVTHTPETGSRNRRHRTKFDARFRRQFFVTMYDF